MDWNPLIIGQLCKAAVPIPLQALVTKRWLFPNGEPTLVFVRVPVIEN